MGDPLYRVVLDTNVMVRGVVNSRSPSGMVLALCDSRRVIPVLSISVLQEYRAVLTDPGLVERFPELTLPKVQKVLARLRYVGDMVTGSRTRFAFERDPKDAKFIELAIAAEASVLVTCDLDLLELPHGREDASKRFRQRLPKLSVVRPEEFVEWFGERRVHKN